MCPMETGGDVEETDWIYFNVQFVHVAVPAAKHLYFIVRATSSSCRGGSTTAETVPGKEGWIESGSKKSLVDGADEEKM
jgi:hypothetical protein